MSVKKANGTPVDGTFRAVITADTRVRSFYRNNEVVVEYAETDNAFTLTIQQSFYDNVVFELDPSITINNETLTINGVTLYNVYK